MRQALFVAVWVGLAVLLPGCPDQGEPDSLTLSPASLALEVGQSADLTANSSATLDTFTWTTSQTDVATVSPQGRVTAVAVGSAEITVTSRRTELTDTATVSVAENLPPAITIGEPSPAATRQGPIDFPVNYTGAAEITLAAADITLNTTGTATGVLGEPVSTGDSARSIPVTDISGDGALSISIAAGTATDTEGNSAPAAGPSAEVIVDNTAPTLEISAPSVTTTNTGPVDYLVSYNGADAISLTTADVLVNGTGTVAATLADVATTSETERTVSFSSIDGDGTLGISLAAATGADQAGNTTPAAGPSAEVVVDNTPPTVTIGAPGPSTTNNGPLVFRVTYEGASAITLAESDVQINGSAGVVAVLDEIEVTSDTVRTIRFSTVAGDGTLGISLAAGTATDTAGNPAPAAGPSATATVDNTAPTVTIGFPSANTTSAGPIVYPVTYEGASDVTLKAADVTLNRTGTANALITAITEAEDGHYDITLGSVIGNGVLGISVAAATATDAAGNAAPAAGPSATVQVENAGPTLLIGPPSSANTFEEPVSYTITYADATAIDLAPADITLNSEDGVTATIAVTGSGTTERTVTLSAFSGLGEVTISIAAGTAQNDAAEQAPAAGPSAPLSVNPLLQPGSGFTAPTPQPDPVGDPGAPGVDAKAIARWDVVPYQTFDGYFNVGVVAFHINDIDRVEFSVDNGPWQAVREMTLNPETDVVEYWIGLDARDFEDGPIEVRAVAYPKVGIPRVLGGEYDLTKSYQGSHWTGEHSLFLSTNASQTLEPQVVELAAGRYTWGEPPIYYGAQPDKERWFIYRPGPGVSSDEVIIDRGAATFPQQRDFKKIKLENLTIEGSSANMNWYADGSDMLWFDKVRIVGVGQHVPAPASARAGHQWWTYCFISDARFGQATQFIRGCRIERIGEDVMQNAFLVLNVNVREVDAGPTDWHSGVIANPMLHDNRVYYGLVSRLIGNSLVWPLRNGTDGHWENFDIAVINCDTESSGRTQIWYCGGDTRNLFIRDSRMVGGAFAWRVSTNVPEYWQFKAHNVVLENLNINDDPEARPNPHPFTGVEIRTTDQKAKLRGGD